MAGAYVAVNIPPGPKEIAYDGTLLIFHPDGHTLWLCGEGKIHTYELPIPWDVTSAI